MSRPLSTVRTRSTVALEVSCAVSAEFVDQLEPFVLVEPAQPHGGPQRHHPVPVLARDKATDALAPHAQSGCDLAAKA